MRIHVMDGRQQAGWLEPEESLVRRLVGYCFIGVLCCIVRSALFQVDFALLVSRCAQWDEFSDLFLQSMLLRV